MVYHPPASAIAAPLPSVSTVIFLLAVVTSSCLVFTGRAEAAELNDYILDYQPLTFNPELLLDRHQRVKDSADPYLRWNFRAYGRTFNLKLTPATSVFASDHHLVVDNTTHPAPDTSHIYEGVLTGEPTSHVHLSIHQGGAVSGSIQVPSRTTFHLEPAHLFFDQPDFQSIIYPESRMNLDPYRHKRAASESHHGESCYSQRLFDKLQSMSQTLGSESSDKKKRDLSDFETFNPYAKYSAEQNTAGSQSGRHRRTRRSLDGTKNTCFISVRADKLLYEHVKANKAGGDDKAAKEWLLSMFALHISAINKIYESTSFKLKGSDTPVYRGIRFQLQRSTIITECGNPWADDYCRDNLDVSNFLDLTSKDNHDTFCLVHTFTYRDFVGGTLGLAWVATPNSQSAGVCGKYGRVSDNGVISTKSLNTGITTLINFNREVASRVSQLTFAHEVGHNFGAQHDKTTECAPFGTSQADASKGNFIMYPSANTGNLPNNNLFSTCSKDYIAKVLQQMGDSSGARTYCFKDSNAAFCGNKVVEGDEECDCGYADECSDACCLARPNEGTNSTMCKRPANIDCSPSQGLCCLSYCAFTDSGNRCQEATDCTKQSTCRGNNATCPTPENQPDNTTFCDNYDRVCEAGECIGSVCKNIGWSECFIADEKTCFVSCKKDESSECVSSFDTDKLNKAEFSAFKNLLEAIQRGKNSSVDMLGVKRAAGSTCNYGKGYCDVFSKCRSYDAEGPFRQLTKMIFNPVTFENIEDWIVDNWWAVLLICVGVVVFMAVFVKLFGYNTPNEDPKKKSRAQPMPRTNPQADKRQVNPKGQKSGAGRAGVYSTDLPMYEGNPYSTRGGGQGQMNQGYQSHPEQNAQPPRGYGAAPYRGPHHQFDRIAEPRYH